MKLARLFFTLRVTLHFQNGLTHFCFADKIDGKVSDNGNKLTYLTWEGAKGIPWHWNLDDLMVVTRKVVPRWERWFA